MRILISFSLTLAMLPGSLLAQTAPEEEPDFTHSVATAKKPWTDKAFRNDPKEFQFAIVTDRTGGMRPGVFPRAVTKVNEMQPEFVITVGDLIAGGSRQRDEVEIRRQWEEFNQFVEGFEMPFFYLPGNHDVSNGVMNRIWDELYGVRYYSFLYKDVLFLCLNTQDGGSTRPFLGEKQIAWAKEEIAKHSDVRWTLVFIHQPLWLMEEGIPRNVNGQRVLRKSKTGWPEIEAALAGRSHTVYAGHVHRYARYRRNEANYYTLGTTGGGSALRGSAFGEFDHATWVTMTGNGPRMMNLTLDGMLEDDVTTEAKQKFWRGLQFSENFVETYPFRDKVVTLQLENPLDTALEGQLTWLLPVSDHWKISTRKASVKLPPGEKSTLEFTVTHDGDLSTFFPLPRLEANFTGADGQFALERALFLPMDLTEHVKKYPARTTATRTDGPPVIDGLLDDAAWKIDPSVTRLIPRRTEGLPVLGTEAWVCYDDRSLYVGIRCEDPVPRDLAREVKVRDGDLGEDDSVVILFDTNRDENSFYHFVVNPEGTLYDARRDDSTWNSSAEVATVIGEDGWTVEMSIPLDEIDGDPGEQGTWGFQMARHRPRLDERESFQWSPTFWYRDTMPAFFGRLDFGGSN